MRTPEDITTRRAHRDMAESLTQLRIYYDLCTPDANDCILTEVLINRLSTQLDHQSLDELKVTLDPEQKGRISFDDFCSAFNDSKTKQSANLTTNHHVEEDTDSELTFNEYDTDKEDGIDGMENLEGFGESMNALSPIASRNGGFNGRRNSSVRRSHRRNKSWAPQNNINSNSPSHLDDNVSVSSDFDSLQDKVDVLQVGFRGVQLNFDLFFD